jgi:hypothetical protein
MRLLVVTLAACLTAIAAAFLIGGRYDFQAMPGYVVRADRITGAMEACSADRCVRLPAAPDLSAYAAPAK